MSSPRVPVLGVGISAVSLPAATSTVLDWIANNQKRYVTVTSVHGVMEAQNDPALKHTLNLSGMAVPDGMPLVWLAKLAGQRHVTQVCGHDLTLSISAALADAGKSAFYYGGGPGVADQLARTLEQRFSGLRTAGTFTPPFRPLTEPEETEIAARINDSGADLVWVGLSTPKQEHWMRRMRPRIDAPVLIGVGAAFDFITGRVKRAPVWMQKAGLEWFYRVLQEPRRLGPRYLRNNPLFLYLLACERLGLRRF